jgi:hypothetical protein
MNTINSDLKDVIDSVKAYIELGRASGTTEFFVDAPDAQCEAHSANGLDALRLEISNCKSCP